ncbi:stress response translation initiation inhibitor YciH [Candidatus Parvarchaeota archaeon]|nr:stress response translation initiation inhibitor YciH [Candidatus Parvarchaeota archaeon]
MTEVCPVCGLPKNLCICGTISQEQQKIKIYTKNVSYKRIVTVISGIDPKLNDVHALTKTLKTKIACGGTYKDIVTVISGIDPKLNDVHALTKTLKTKIACGGTYKDNVIELQGDHVEKAKKILLENGFPKSAFE